MTWTYDKTLGTNKDKVRFYAGDVDSTDQLVSDEEITATITLQGSALSAAILICEHLAARYARQVDKDVGPFSLSNSQRAAQFAATARRLRTTLGATVSPYCGGIDSDRKTTVEDDETLVKPAFKVDMLTRDDNEWVDEEEQP